MAGARDHGIALQIFGAKSKKSYFTFPLPKLVLGDGEFKFSRIRLWECDRSLHISYYDVDGLWLWKLHWGCGSTDNVENWNRIPQLVISNTLQLSTLKFFTKILDSKQLSGDSLALSDLTLKFIAPLRVILLIEQSNFEQSSQELSSLEIPSVLELSSITQKTVILDSM
uniref:Uncharacterized protein n=1 Tax=Chenopodium quinoa TaxID=63459 RepID=A0A803MYN8_CHEQI